MTKLHPIVMQFTYASQPSKRGRRFSPPFHQGDRNTLSNCYQGFKLSRVADELQSFGSECESRPLSETDGIAHGHESSWPTSPGVPGLALLADKFMATDTVYLDSRHH